MAYRYICFVRQSFKRCDSEKGTDQREKKSSLKTAVKKMIAKKCVITKPVTMISVDFVL
jgi:hypothetical protein